MKKYIRKTAPKVKDGIVQHKNNWDKTPNIFNSEFQNPVFDKERPGPGYKHLIKKKELYEFIDMIPDWRELSFGLNAVLLASGDERLLGWYGSGVVAICAWERHIPWDECTEGFYKEHSDILNKIGVPCEKQGKYWALDFTEKTAKAFQLIHVFIHELGHHHDRMTTRYKKRSGRGEPYADNYAKNHEDEILEKYRDKYNLF